MKKRGKCAAMVLLSLSVLMGITGTAYADEPITDFEAAKQASYDTIPETNNLPGWPQGPQVYGNSAIVMDMNSGAVLYGKKVDDRHYPASITKILTALVALENSKPEDQVYFSENSVSFLEYGDASIGMTPGEILSRKDAMYGMLLASANEVSYAIAESVGKLMGGGYDTFIQEMNDRSTELGCTGSHWVNANGLHDEQHYTTAHDMALIASAAYQFDEFRTVTQTLNYTIGVTNLVQETRTFQQNHKMLWPGTEYYYEFCTGGKTGYTDQSRTTLVTMADNGDLQLVAVVLQDDGNSYVDTRALFDYAYGNFVKVPLKDQKKPQAVKSYKDPEAYVLLPAGIDFSSLEKEITISNEKMAEGRVTYLYEGQNVGSADVILTAEYIKEKTGLVIEKGGTGKKSDSKEKGTGSVVRLIICIAAVLLLAVIAAAIVLRYHYVKQRRRRMARMRRRRRTSQYRQGPDRYYNYPEEKRRGSPRNQRYEEPVRRDRNGRYR